MPDKALTIEEARELPTMTVEQAAAFLNISRQAAYNGCHSGDIPSIRVNGKILVAVPLLLKQLGVVDEDANRGLEAGRAVLDRCHAAAEERARQASARRMRGLGPGCAISPYVDLAMVVEEKAAAALADRARRIREGGRRSTVRTGPFVGDTNKPRGATQPSPYRNRD
jgi:hypothetical protein